MELFFSDYIKRSVCLFQTTIMFPFYFIQEQRYYQFFTSLFHCNFSESPWHLTICGFNGSAAINSAELYNWQSGAQCFIEYLPQVNLLKLVLKHQSIIEIFQREWLVILEHH